MFFNQYPYINLNDLNLDYILKTLREMGQTLSDFIAFNTIKFADPMEWDLLTSYTKNTVVIDNNGNAYLSIKDVPSGVTLDNTDYWNEVFNFSEYVEKSNKNFTDNFLKNVTTAPNNYNAGDWLIIDEVLYKVISPISEGQTFVIGTNIEHFTIENFLADFITTINNTVLQYKNDIDLSEVNYRNQLAGDVAATTASLQSQFNAAISGLTPVDSEVVNGRIGTNGTTYATIGEAIRDQVGTLNYKLLNENNLLTKATLILNKTYNAGTIANNNAFMYFIVPVTNGVKYLIGRGFRFLSKSNALITQAVYYNDYEYTADFTGDLYVTYYKDTNFGIPFVGVAGTNNTRMWLSEYADSPLLNKFNLLTHSKCVENSYYYASRTTSTGYVYFIINVKNGTSYTLAPHVRMISKQSAGIDNVERATESTYIADYDGLLYVTFTKGYANNYYVCETAHVNEGRGWFSDYVLSRYGNDSRYAGLSAAGSPYSRFYNKNLLNIGDSIANTRPGINGYGRQFCELTGANRKYDIAHEGDTLSKTADQGVRGSVYDQALDAITNYPDPDAFDYIFIEGCVNDYGLNRQLGNIVKTNGEYTESDYNAIFNESTILGAAESIFKMLRNAYPAAIILFVIPHKMPNRTDAYYYQIVNGLREVCYKWSIPVADLDKNGELNTRIAVFQNSLYADGGTHPTTEGTQKFYVPNIVNELLKYN